MHGETLAIDGASPLRTRPFGPRWVIGEAERRQVLEVIDSADTTWRSFCLYVYTVDEAVAGVSSERFAEAVRAEGIPDCHGPYLGGKPQYRYPLFTEERTYGRSRYPFIDEAGRRRVDYVALHPPNIDRVLPTTGRITLRNTYTEEDAWDIAAAMKKVALSSARRRAPVRS